MAGIGPTRKPDDTRARRNKDAGPLLQRGEPVTVGRAAVELALWQRDRDGHAGRVRLPVARGVKRVRVSPDDRIVPAADLDWDGGVVGGR
jgi:hypothetical protein